MTVHAGGLDRPGNPHVLTSLKDILAHARAHQYAVPAFDCVEDVMVRAILETIAAQAPLAVQATLAAARLAQDAGPQTAMEQLLPQLLVLLKTDDAREGLMSFVERRAAQFQGK